MMVSRGRLIKPILLLFFLVILNSCALIPGKPARKIYYTIPSVTYVRESPGYASRTIATVYRGEQVEILSKTKEDWSQVRTVKGQEVGWIQHPLLSPVPIPAESLYVQQETPLRDTPQPEGISRRVLQRGDKVTKLSDNQRGWWRVLVDKDESLGWLPAAMVSDRQPETAPSPKKAAHLSEKSPPGVSAALPPAVPQNLYVAVASLDLHLLPLVGSQVVKVLKFNDKVEKIAQSSPQWLKIRFPETGAQGWAQALFLAASPLKTPKVFPPKKKKSPSKSRRLKPDDTEPEIVEPEVM